MTKDNNIDYNIIAMAAMLKEWRIRCDLTVYRISKEIGLDPHAIARIERAEPVHSDTLLQYLAFIRRADPSWDIIAEWEKMRSFLQNIPVGEK